MTKQKDNILKDTFNAKQDIESTLVSTDLKMNKDNLAYTHSWVDSTFITMKYCKLVQHEWGLDNKWINSKGEMQTPHVLHKET